MKNTECSDLHGCDLELRSVFAQFSFISMLHMCHAPGVNSPLGYAQRLPICIMWPGEYEGDWLCNAAKRNANLHSGTARVPTRTPAPLWLPSCAFGLQDTIASRSSNVYFVPTNRKGTQYTKCQLWEDASGTQGTVELRRLHKLAKTQLLGSRGTSSRSTGGLLAHSKRLIIYMYFRFSERFLLSPWERKASLLAGGDDYGGDLLK